MTRAAGSGIAQLAAPRSELARNFSLARISRFRLSDISSHRSMLLTPSRRRRRASSFKDSIKALEADIEHANTVASEFARDFDGACLQMRLSYSPAAHFFLFLLRWTDCSLAGALGLIRILIHKVFRDGSTTMLTHERKASLREFYDPFSVFVPAYIYPSLQQLQGGLSELKQQKVKKQQDANTQQHQEQQQRLKQGLTQQQQQDQATANTLTGLDAEVERECGICMEDTSKIALPGCNHAMCIKCYRDWHARAQSCPFCRDSLKRVNSADLWIMTEASDTRDATVLEKESFERLYMFIDKLPLLVSDRFSSYQINASNRALLRALGMKQQQCHK